MSKGMLIVDMPNNCKECDFYNATFLMCECNHKNKIMKDTYPTKPEWCPILPLFKESGGIEENHNGI